jgi:hypothetical protein
MEGHTFVPTRKRNRHSHEYFRWAALPNSVLFALLVLAGDVIVVALYLLVNLQIWEDWIVPLEAGFFTAHSLLILSRKPIAHTVNPLTGAAHLNHAQRNTLQGLLSFALTADVVTWGRTLDVMRGYPTANDKAKFALLSVVLFSTFIRCIELWMIRDTEYNTFEPPVWSRADDHEGDTSGRYCAMNTRKRTGRQKRSSSTRFGAGGD